jgi:uncharacterized repeat protein (TIGR03843 family)
VSTPERDVPQLATVPLEGAAALRLLRDGELELVGRLVVSSNNALLGTVTLPGQDDAEPLTAPAVYKPIRGERPLWDFPDGTLAAREVATYVVSEATPWAIVPPTVLRDGPFGPGMVQLWLEPNESVDRVALVVEGDERLRTMALLDVVVNNADRKVGHVLPMDDGHVFGVDHGICFHEEPKLRTVLWRWAGEPLRDGECEALRELRVALGGATGRSLRDLLTAAEVRATLRRLDTLLATAVFPQPDPDRPAIPWPPY